MGCPKPICDAAWASSRCLNGMQPTAARPIALTTASLYWQCRYHQHGHAEDACMSCSIFHCRQPPAASLTDIIADTGTPVRLRFSCSITADSQAREQELPMTINLKQALCNLRLLCLSQVDNSGELCSVLVCLPLLAWPVQFQRCCRITHDYDQSIVYYTCQTRPPAQGVAFPVDKTETQIEGAKMLPSLFLKRFLLYAGTPRDLFQHSNRMGVSQTLHRISALKNRSGDICGLTYRIGRHVPGMELAYNWLCGDVLSVTCDIGCWSSQYAHQKLCAVCCGCQGAHCSR